MMKGRVSCIVAILIQDERVCVCVLRCSVASVRQYNVDTPLSPV